MFIAPCLFKAFLSFGKSKIGQAQGAYTIYIWNLKKFIDATADQ